MCPVQTIRRSGNRGPPVVAAVIGGVLSLMSVVEESRRRFRAISLSSIEGTCTETATSAQRRTAVRPRLSLGLSAGDGSRADHICLSFRSQIEQATAAADSPRLTQVYQAELDQLRNLPDPDQDGDVIRTFVNNGTEAVNFLVQNDINDFNVQILAAETVAGEFGMKVCNSGH